MKNFVLGTTLLGVGVLFGSSEFIQGLAKDLQSGMEVLEANTIRLVDVSQDEKNQVTSADEKRGDEATDEKVAVEKTFWIGATLGPIPEPILAHLPEDSLEADKGVCLMGILPESPAEKAGLKTFDVVAKVNGEAADSEKIIQCVRSSEGKKVQFEILRAGKTQTIEVTPEEREMKSGIGLGKIWQQIPVDPQADFFRGMIPEDALKMAPQLFGEEGVWPEGFPIPDDVRKMLKQYRDDFRHEFRGPDFPKDPNIQGNQKSQMRIEITPNGMESSRQMTTVENGKAFSISVRKSGEAPAKILVEWDDESYETTEDKLDVLPEEIRDRVKSFLESENVKVFSGNSTDAPITEALPSPSEDAEGAAIKEGEKQTKKNNEKEIEIQKEDVIDLK